MPPLPILLLALVTKRFVLKTTLSSPSPSNLVVLPLVPDGGEALDQHGVGVVVGAVPGVGVHVAQVLQLQLHQPALQGPTVAQAHRKLIRLVL